MTKFKIKGVGKSLWEWCLSAIWSEYDYKVHTTEDVSSTYVINLFVFILVVHKIIWISNTLLFPQDPEWSTGRRAFIKRSTICWEALNSAETEDKVILLDLALPRDWFHSIQRDYSWITYLSA